MLDLLHAAQIPLDAPAGQLKVGEKQIVEIAKTLLDNSRLLIMDEPTAALNSVEVSTLFSIIRTLKERGVTILYVSHRLSEIFELADSVTVLRDGRHIRTSPIGAVTADALITDMIGRKLEGIYPQRNRELGGIVLAVRELSAAGAVSNVSFDLHAGEVLAVTGLSGSGKTELAKALFGDWPLEAAKLSCSAGQGGSTRPMPLPPASATCRRIARWKAFWPRCR